MTTEVGQVENSLTGGIFEDMERIHFGLMPAKEHLYKADLSSLPVRKGAVAMRRRTKSNDGDLVSTEFSIFCDDKSCSSQQVSTVFGYVISRMDVCEEISRLNSSSTSKVAIVADCGDWFEIKE